MERVSPKLVTRASEWLDTFKFYADERSLNASVTSKDKTVSNIEETPLTTIAPNHSSPDLKRKSRLETEGNGHDENTKHTNLTDQETRTSHQVSHPVPQKKPCLQTIRTTND